MSDEVQDELDEVKADKIIEIGEDDAEVVEVVDPELIDGTLSLDALAEEEEDAELDMDSYDDKDMF